MQVDVPGQPPVLLRRLSRKSIELRAVRCAAH
jgi:hypothetical protein